MTFQKKSQLLEVIQEYKSDNSALKEQITDLQKQLSSAESRIKQLLIKYEHSVHDNIKNEEAQKMIANAKQAISKNDIKDKDKYILSYKIDTLQEITR